MAFGLIADRGGRGRHAGGGGSIREFDRYGVSVPRTGDFLGNNAIVLPDHPLRSCVAVPEKPGASGSLWFRESVLSGARRHQERARRSEDAFELRLETVPVANL